MGRKQARKYVWDARDFNNIETRAVIKFFFLQVRAAGYSLKPGHHSSLTAPNLQPTANQERDDQCGNEHYSHELLMMGILVPETCWTFKKHNKIMTRFNTYKIYIYTHTHIHQTFYPFLDLHFEKCLLLYVKVLNSWWWTERPSETCSVSFQNNIFDSMVHRVGFTVKIYPFPYTTTQQLKFMYILWVHNRLIAWSQKK
jgi:hypothetical protein